MGGTRFALGDGWGGIKRGDGWGNGNKERKKMKNLYKIKRRLKEVQITAEFLLQWLKIGEHHYRSIENPIPEEAEIVRAGCNEFYGDFFLLIEAKEFGEVEPGDEIPVFKPWHEVIR